MARRQRDFTDNLLVVLTVMVLLAALAVVMAVIFPEVAMDIVSAGSDPYAYP